MFLGREEELSILKDQQEHRLSRLVVLYGRRRVGKSSLLKEFLKNYTHTIYIEGLERRSSTEQIDNFRIELSKQIKDRVLPNITIADWRTMLSYLTDNFILKTKERKIICLDEFQWMCSNRSALVSLLKFFWDNYWKDSNVVLILCGSIASFMVNKVINSKALYGRFSCTLSIKGLSPKEAVKLFRHKRGQLEILKYLLIFGGIPRYLEEIDLNKSFEQNINHLCFSKQSPFLNEVEKIFYSQFKEYQSYKKIITKLDNKLLNLSEISKVTGIASGGGLKNYMRNLENAEFIQSYKSIFSPDGNEKYKVSDEYLRFYFKYISSKKTDLTHLNTVKDLSGFAIWLGFAFENFCIKNSLGIAKKLGFLDEVIDYGPIFKTASSNFQVDLAFKRNNNIYTICEIKYYNNPVSTVVIPEVERKVLLLRDKIKEGATIEKCLITPVGGSKELIASGYFNHVVTVKELLAI